MYLSIYTTTILFQLSHISSSIISHLFLFFMASSCCCLQWLLFVQALLVVAASSDSCHFPAIFNFGDSNSDTGGLSAAFGAAPPSHGESFFGKPAGRYCDGRLLIDFIASSLGLPFLSAYLNSIGTNFSHGANFATAGSTIRQPYATLTQSGFSPISMDVQTWEFSQFKSRSQALIQQGTQYQLLSWCELRHGGVDDQAALRHTDPVRLQPHLHGRPDLGILPVQVSLPSTYPARSRINSLIYEFIIHKLNYRLCVGLFKDQLPKEEYFSQALYTIDIGQNDLTEGYFRNWTTDEVKSVIPDILDKFVLAIQSIYWEGGRYFWIHNTGPFGCLPYVLDRLTLKAPEVDRFGCGAPFNHVAQLFNQKLNKTLSQLRKDLPFGVFTYVDIYSIKHELLSHAHQHGFELPLVACCGHGGKYNYNINIGCGSTMTKNGKEVMVGKACQNPSKRIIWDGVHYTDTANKWIFQQIVNGKFSDPPVPLRLACKVKA
ncbi:hypothetical protein ZIOFF_015292 [Zingiber officinale]|uniref:Uncharacterized protein n=1 Tax=Zingiber officinale TaxID=94328 RepID=A0A8J5HCT3_ZINOF|nr:hypothetical protein ZIOFF_015292 [Zingiber officinale]